MHEIRGGGILRRELLKTIEREWARGGCWCQMLKQTCSLFPQSLVTRWLRGVTSAGETKKLMIRSAQSS
jgi:hypothetical protein